MRCPCGISRLFPNLQVATEGGEGTRVAGNVMAADGGA